MQTFTKMLKHDTVLNNSYGWELKKGIYLEDCKADAIGLAMLVDKWASILWPTVMSTPGVESRNEAASWAQEE